MEAIVDYLEKIKSPDLEKALQQLNVLIHMNAKRKIMEFPLLFMEKIVGRSLRTP